MSCTWMLARSFGNTAIFELALGNKLCQTNSIDKFSRTKDLNNRQNDGRNILNLSDLERCTTPKAIARVCVFICPTTKTARFVLIAQEPLYGRLTLCEREGRSERNMRRKIQRSNSCVSRAACLKVTTLVFREAREEGTNLALRRMVPDHIPLHKSANGDDGAALH
jgi:hypothetical protein